MESPRADSPRDDSSTGAREVRPAAGATFVYRVVLLLAGIVAAVVVGFFLVGLGDGSVSSFNLGLWLGLLTLTAAVVVGGRSLRARGHTRAAIALLGVLALPGLLYGLFVLLIVFSGARWN